jgi:hypothetical protein
VVDVSAGVEHEVLGQPVDVGEVVLLAGFGQLGEGVVGAGHVGGMVLAVVQLHDPRRDVGLQRGVVVVKFGQYVGGHVFFLTV